MSAAGAAKREALRQAQLQAQQAAAATGASSSSKWQPRMVLNRLRPSSMTPADKSATVKTIAVASVLGLVVGFALAFVASR